LAIAYGFANPPFEAADEIRHFRYVRYLALNQSLPPVSAEASAQLQAHHPPLYYALAALISAPVQSGAAADYSPPINPFWGFRYFEPSNDNKNQYLHAPDERWQFTGTTLVLYLGRWLSTLFGLGTVLMAHRMGRDLFPDRPFIALGTMAFVAFNPMFLHGSASLNNDTAAAFFGAWVIAEAAAIAQYGSTRGRAVALGAALGLGIISKASVIPLTVVAAVAFFLPRISRIGELVRVIRGIRGRDFLVAFGVAAALSGWWFARNTLQTGDAMGLNDYQSAWVGQADRARLIGEALSGLPYAWTTFWGRFDYGQVVMPAWVYGGMGVACALGVAGLIRARNELRARGMVIVALAIAVSLAGWGALMITIPATANARLIFQIFPALGLLLTLGWRGLLPSKYQDTKLLGFGIWGLGFSFSLFALFGYLVPAFAYPRSVASLPGGATPASANFEGAAEIVGYQISSVEAQPGDELDVTVFWKPLAQTASPLQVFVHLVDSQGIIAAQRDTYPGLGNAVTTIWRVGQIFADTYRVFLPDTAYAPETLTARVGLWNNGENRPLITNESDALDVGTVQLQPRVGGAPNPISIIFANQMELVGYALDSRVVTPGATVLLTTYWNATAPDSDYWAYAHLVGADGRIWAIADSVILPPVTLWRRGETQSEMRQIVLAPDTPPGQYTLEFGLTRILNPGQERLGVLADDGHEVGDHIELAKILVVAP
ncbi:MAG: glycosyltransferase family 39 protein, partial [Chloroflexota bacterium]